MKQLTATTSLTAHLLLIALMFIPSLVHADDWPQWMGPERSGEWQEDGVVQSIPKSGLPVVWRTPIAGGYAGPAVAGSHVYVTDYVRSEGEPVNDPGKRAELTGTERVLCLDIATGKEVWRHEYPRTYKISYPCGPRATPTVDGEFVYLLGAEGNLLCLRRVNGEVVWSKDLQKEYKTTAPIWGFAAHPLIEGNHLICMVGGEGSVVVAFDKLTGKEKWKALSASEPGYCPPSIQECAGVRQLIIWDADKMHGLDAQSGKVYWSVPLKPNYGMSIALPRRSGNLLFASGIGDVAALVKLDEAKPQAEIAWKASKAKESVYAANTTPIIVDDTIYGVDCDSGGLMAVDLESGQRLWESFAATTGKRRAGHGTAFLVKNNGLFYIFTETGDLVLARLSRDKYEEVGRFHVLEPTGEAFGRAVVWSHPAFAQRRMFARNDKEIVCVDLSASK